MHPCEIVINIVLSVAFILFNISFWIGEWSKSQVDTQGLFEWCLNTEADKCCQSISDTEIDTQDLFYHFQNSIIAAWVFITVTVFLFPYCSLFEWNEKKMRIIVLPTVTCISAAVSLMVAVSIYGFYIKTTISLTHHKLHSSFWIAVVCLLLYISAGILMIAYIVYCNELYKKLCDFCKNCCGTNSDDVTSIPEASSDDSISGTSIPFNVSTAFYTGRNNSDYFGNRFQRPTQQFHTINTIDDYEPLPNVPGTQLTGFEDRDKYLEIVPANSYEYSNVRQSFQSNNGNFKIIQIYKVQNDRLHRAHILFGRDFMATARRNYQCSYRKYLWHGTSENSCENINQYGLNRNYQGKNACVYGAGLYFARDPSYSSMDTYSVPGRNGDKFVYKCSVFVGRYGQGERNLKEPPKDINGVRYDSVVDDLRDPKIHVIFRDNQAYAEYLIKFNNARY